MKVVPQIITFLILLVIGWFLYDSHSAFKDLIDDIIDYSGVSREINRPAIEVARPKTTTPRTVKPQREAEPGQITISATPTTDEAQPAATADAADTLQWPEPDKSTAPSSEMVKDFTEEDAAISSPSNVAESMPEIQSEGLGKDQQTAPVAPVQLPAGPPESVIQPVTESVNPPAASAQTESSAEPVSAPVPEPQTEVMEAPGGLIADEPGGKSVPPDPSTTLEPLVGSGITPEQERTEDKLSDNINDRKQKALSGLATARAAWHQGHHDKAIMLYGQLLREFRNHPDFAGELGNIYFSKGEIELAVNAYSEAYLRLLRNKDMQRAEQVLGIVYNIDQEQAALLREYIDR